MKVRRPALDFSDTPAHWAQWPEYAQFTNASSLWIPHLERFLNKVLARTLSYLKERDRLDPALKADVRTFIQQESNHYALHEQYNRILTRDGYDVAHFERHFEAAFDTLLQTRSIPFLTAYCEGFETLGPPAALMWLDENEDMLAGAHPEPVRLWKWHLMEEFEHRHVCHEVFHAVHGGYALRIYGFLYQLRQLQGFSSMVYEYLLAADRAKMTPAERAESVHRQKLVQSRAKRLMLPRLLKVFSPAYTPRNAPEPRMFKAYRSEVEARLP